MLQQWKQFSLTKISQLFLWKIFKIAVLVDLTSLQDAAEQLHYPELSGESLRLEMFFQFPLEQVTEVMVRGERLSNVQINKFGTVAKNGYFLWVFGFLQK